MWGFLHKIWRLNAYPKCLEGDIQQRKLAKKKLREAAIAIKDEPNNANRYVDRSKIYESVKSYDLAVQDLSIAMDLDPQKTYFYLYLRHNQYLGMGNLEKALEDIKTALNLAPEGFSYFKNVARVYQQLGQTENAINVLTDGITKYPNSPQSFLDRADFYEGIGRLHEALKDVNEALKIQPMFHRHARVRIYIKLGQFEDALNDCNQCIAADPKDWTHFRVRSQVYEAMGEHAAAASDYYESMNLNPCINR